MTEQPDELITTIEAAALLKVSRRTIERYVAAGQLPYRVTPGNKRRYLRSDVLGACRQAA